MPRVLAMTPANVAADLPEANDQATFAGTLRPVPRLDLTSARSHLPHEASPMSTETDLLPPVEFPPSVRPRAPLNLPTPATIKSPEPARSPWRNEPPQRGRRRRRRLLLGGGVLAIVATTFIWAASWFAPPPPVRMTLVGAGYEENLALPHNVYGWNSLRDLAALWEEGSHASYWAQRFWSEPPQPQRLNGDKNWQELFPAQDGKLCVLYCAAHGAVDEHGPYLLTDNATNKPTPQTRLRLTDLLEHLATLPREQHKVLVLDVVNFECQLTLGVLHNDFAASLETLAPRIENIPNLVVVVSSSSDERSWPCPAWSRSTFSHFWIEGLRGAAIDRNDDGRISLTELFDFTKAETAHWVYTQFNVHQTPLMLPAGDLGRERANKMVLAWHDQNYTPSPASSNVPTQVPERLLAAWKTAASMSTYRKPPYQTQPQAWRRYLATLKRYEQLVLAGDVLHAERVHTQLQALVVQLHHDPTAELTSLDAQRAASAFIWPAVKSDDPESLGIRAQTALDALAAVPPDQWAATWKKLANDAHAEAKLLRATMFRLLAERAASDPVYQLHPVRQLVEAIRDPLNPLPPALHFLVMLDRDLPLEARTLEASPVVAQALRVRQLAEQAAGGDVRGFTPTTPLVRRWVGPTVLEADALRQQGEDLLFGNAANREAAAKYLQEAEQLYRQALHAGQAVQAAYLARDEAYAALPELTIDLTLLPDSLLADLQQCGFKDQMLAYWQAAHALTAQLATADLAEVEQPTAKPGLDGQSLSLIERTRAMQALHGILRDKLVELWRTHGEQLHGSSGLLVDYLPDSAGLSPALRQAVVDRGLEGTSRRREDMLGLLMLAAGGNLFAEPATPVNQEESERRVQAAARVRGELALAMFGPHMFAESAGESDLTWEQAQHLLNIFAVEEDWRHSLAELGRQIAARWQTLPIKAERSLESQLANSTTISAVCVQADSWSRATPPALAEQLTDRVSRDLQRMRLMLYLLWEAERTLTDHWSGPSDEMEPYYRTLASALVLDAQRVAAPEVLWKPLQANILNNDDWNWQAPQVAVLTPELPLCEDFQVLSGSAPRDGFVTLQTDLGSGLTELRAAPLSAQAYAWPKAGAPLPYVVQAQMAEATAAELKSQMQYSAYYRGRRVSGNLPVQLHPRPESRAIEPTPPARAIVAVTSSPDLNERFARGRGAVAIVLDASGSMGAKEGQPFDDKTRYAQATTALAKVLQGVPAGTQLSVWIFGQAVGSQKTVTKAEQTIRCVRTLAAWNPADAKATQQLLSAVSYPQVEPWNESAVMHAMLAAKADLVALRGFKTLVVITDGLDNRFAHDSVDNPQQLDVGTAIIEQFQGTGIVVNVVGFQIDSKQEQQAYEQFSVIETLDPPGKFYRVDQSGELVAALDASFDQKLRFWLEDYDHRPAPGVPQAGAVLAGEGVSLPNDRIQTVPGEYQLRVVADQPLSAAVSLVGGDCLTAQLTAADQYAQNLQLLRAEMLPTLYPRAQAVEAGSWRAATLETSTVPGEPAARVRVGLERVSDPREVQLGVPKPAEIWWELTTGVDQLPCFVSATRVYDAGLLAWNVELACLPGATPPATLAAELKGWWVPPLEPIASTTLVAGRDFNKLEDLAGRTIEMDGAKLQIREATHDVATNNLRLIVDGAPQTTLWVRLRNLPVTATEHRHYTSLGRYVGDFGLTDAPALAASGWHVEFISLPVLKRRAEQLGTQVRFSSLLMPMSDAHAPSQP
jgi:hypothetical protein